MEYLDSPDLNAADLEEDLAAAAADALIPETGEDLPAEAAPEDLPAESSVVEIDLTELTQQISGLQESVATLQEETKVYQEECLKSLAALHSNSMIIVLILLLIFARSCVTAARSYLENSGKAVKK